MASLSDLKLRYRLFMRSYSYQSLDWSPAALNKPLSEARVATVTTAAFHLPHQPAFDESVKGGDASYREIPLGADLESLMVAHKSEAFDAAGIESDKNLALPVEDLLELERKKEIGSVNGRHFSFMGSIQDPSRLISETAPRVAALLSEDGADAVLLTPV